MRINHNIQALNAYRNLAANQMSTSKNLERLSSGLRINRASDDAAGLAISEKMRSQIRGLDVAERNALDAVSLIQTAEGGLQEVHSILQRMRELSVQAANGTYKTEDLSHIQAEINQLKSEITRISTDTEFNGIKLLDGSASDLVFQIGANESQTLKLAISDMKSLGGTVDVTTDAEGAISALDTDINIVSSERAKLGAVQNRLEHTMNNLQVTNENMVSSESRIRDLDMAKEMTEFTKNNILNQAAQAMLAQSNQLPQGILQLLK